MSYSDYEEEISDLNYELDEVRSRNYDLESELSSLKNELADLQAQKEHLEDENEDLEVKFESLDVEFYNLSENYDSMKKEFEEAKEIVDKYQELMDTTVINISRETVEGCLSQILNVRSDFLPEDMINMTSRLLQDCDFDTILAELIDASFKATGVDLSEFTPTYVLEITEDEKLILHKNDKVTWGSSRILLHESYFEKLWKYKDEMKTIDKNKLSFSREILSYI